MSLYCDAEHPNAQNGCYGITHHDGKHWSYADYIRDRTGAFTSESGNLIWEWDDTPQPRRYRQAAQPLCSLRWSFSSSSGHWATTTKTPAWTS
jgi:hypothetical protein